MDPTPLTAKNAFSSAYGFLITAIGFAVGVGSIWRFPYMVGANGGALYLITYVVIIAVIGIPLLTAEITMGFHTQVSAVKAYRELEPAKQPWHVAGWVHLAGGLLIIAYTLPIYAWVLKYLVATPLGELSQLDASGIEAFFGAFTADRWQVLIFAVVNIAINAVIVMGGVKRGVELMSKILLPMLGVIMVILIVFELNLPDAMGGVTFLLQPNPANFSLATVQAALGQAFFAVGIAMLASMVFGSYIKNKRENIGRSATVISSALVLAGLLAGFMIFPVLFSVGLEPAAGPGLVFMTLPNAFNQIPLGTLMGTLFFIGFYVAAVTSSAGVMESIVGLLMDQFKLKRLPALGLTVLGMGGIGAACIFSDDLFNWLDLVENNYILTLGALVISIFVGWVWGADNFVAATNVKSKFFQVWLKVTVKYVSPIAILVIFVGSFFS